MQIENNNEQEVRENFFSEDQHEEIKQTLGLMKHSLDTQSIITSPALIKGVPALVFYGEYPLDENSDELTPIPLAILCTPPVVDLLNTDAQGVAIPEEQIEEAFREAHKKSNW